MQWVLSRQSARIQTQHQACSQVLYSCTAFSSCCVLAGKSNYHSPGRCLTPCDCHNLSVVYLFFAPIWTENNNNKEKLCLPTPPPSVERAASRALKYRHKLLEDKCLNHFCPIKAPLRLLCSGGRSKQGHTTHKGIKPNPPAISCCVSYLIRLLF